MLKNLVLAAATSLAMSTAAFAGWAPPGPVNLQIGFGAGGETDTLGRVIASVMEEQTGWQVIAENKPGGGGIAMFTGIAVGPNDGSVIGLGVNMPVMINLVLRGDKLPFNLDSFDYLGTVARAQLAIIAKGDAPFNDIKGLVEYSKANGGVAVAFDAKPQELLLQRINAETGANLKPLSTKSSAEELQLLLGGQVVAAFNAGKHIPFIEKGEMKMIASANKDRHNYAPDTPTLIEQGIDAYVDPFFYFAAPVGLSAEAKEGLSTALANAIASDKVKKIVADALANEVNNLGPDGTKQMLVDGMVVVKVLFGK